MNTPVMATVTMPSTTRSGLPSFLPHWIRNPRPPLAARSSAPTRFIQHHASAIWSAPKTIGRAEGMHTVQKSCQFVCDKLADARALAASWMNDRGEP